MVPPAVFSRRWRLHAGFQFNAPNGDLGEDKGVTKQLRVPTAGINKTADFKGSWNGQISFIHADNHESGMFTCKYKTKTGGYYVFTIQR
jgi:hypothetical protein